jgi:putative PIN family toxin of toxin-antitoxin system
MSVLAVLDTNIVVSAGIQPAGPSAQVVDAALGGAIVMVICPMIVSEYMEVVNRPRFKKWKFPPLWLTTLIAGAHMVDEDVPNWPSPGPDPDDLVFLALAHRTGAILVTGNMADHPERIRHDVTVMAPAEYIRHLRGLSDDSWSG